jgi:hypothetical protein
MGMIQREEPSDDEDEDVDDDEDEDEDDEWRMSYTSTFLLWSYLSTRLLHKK